MNNKVLVLAVHPDDETLGCGGTLLKHKAAGDEIHWLIATTANEQVGFSAEQVLEKRREIDAVAQTYPFDSIHELGLPAARVDTLPLGDIVARLSALLYELRPTMVYLPFKGDVHSDHRILFECFWSASKTFRYQFLRKVLMMETVSETDFAPPLPENAFLPNSYVDISAHLERKLEILSLYQSELGPPPFPRNLENLRMLAGWRGSQAHCRYAEGFVLLKELW